MNETSLNYEKLKYISQNIENVISNIDIEKVEITNKQLVINDCVIVKYHNETLKVYHDDITLCEEVVNNFNLSLINCNLIKIELSINDKQLERYYYVGRNL